MSHFPGFDHVKNESFRNYAHIYVRIGEDYTAKIAASGISLSTDVPKVNKLHAELKERGAIVGNNGRSIHVNWLSPSCVACRTGKGCATYFLSLRCPRQCYYCFNPNQEDYAVFCQQQQNCLEQLQALHDRHYPLAHLGLTGGEPLLHKTETIEFFRFARAAFPAVHSRLYTAGDQLDAHTLAELEHARLDEIRFSIKLDDPRQVRDTVLEKIGLAKNYIPHVIVEMPVIPGTSAAMKELLLQLNEMEITGINLLEFCYPWHNAAEFTKRGFTVKNPPYQILYDYWYSGGLPIAHSETEALELLRFALDESLSLGVHYCSVENKLTGQVLQQNSAVQIPSLFHRSRQDHFLKAAKVFGSHIPLVLEAFHQRQVHQYQINPAHDFIEFHVREVEHMRSLPVEIGLSSYIAEAAVSEPRLREVSIRPLTSEDPPWHDL